MFSRISTVIFYAFFAFSLLAAATSSPTTTTVTHPQPTPTQIPAEQCNVGGLQCCETVEPASDTAIAMVLKTLGIIAQDLSTPVGVTCSPIDVFGVGAGGPCTAHPVCCTGLNFRGLVAIGCFPTILSV